MKSKRMKSDVVDTIENNGGSHVVFQVNLTAAEGEDFTLDAYILKNLPAAIIFYGLKTLQEAIREYVAEKLAEGVEGYEELSKKIETSEAVMERYVKDRGDFTS